MGSSEGTVGTFSAPTHCIAWGPRSQKGAGTPNSHADTSVAGWSGSGSGSELQLKSPSPECLKTITAAAWAGGETWRNTMMLMPRKAKRQTFWKVITLPSCAHFPRHWHCWAVTLSPLSCRRKQACVRREAPLLC